MLENLITDRSYADVEAVKALEKVIKAGTATEEQVQQYLNGHQKGAYTYEDLTRVELAVQYVAAELNKYGYMPVLPIIRIWNMSDIPNADDFARYLNNVAQIRAAVAVWPTTPAAPTSATGFDVYKANAMEQILLDVVRILDHIKDAWLYSGDLYLGED